MIRDIDNLLSAFPTDVPMVPTQSIRATIKHESEDGEAAWEGVTAYDAFGGDYEAWQGHGNPIVMYLCSKCGHEPLCDGEGEYVLSEYCPYCGRKIVVRQR